MVMTIVSSGSSCCSACAVITMAAAIMAGAKVPGSGSFCCCAAAGITATASAMAAAPAKTFFRAPDFCGSLSYFAEKIPERGFPSFYNKGEVIEMLERRKKENQVLAWVESEKEGLLERAYDVEYPFLGAFYAQCV